MVPWNFHMLTRRHKHTPTHSYRCFISMTFAFHFLKSWICQTPYISIRGHAHTNVGLLISIATIPMYHRFNSCNCDQNIHICVFFPFTFLPCRICLWAWHIFEYECLNRVFFVCVSVCQMNEIRRHAPNVDQVYVLLPSSMTHKHSVSLHPSIHPFPHLPYEAFIYIGP